MITEQQIDNFKAGIANDLRNELVTKVPVDTGRLKNSIKTKFEGDDIIVEMNDYALYVEYGTAPHIIRPKDKKSLRFKKDGKTIFAKEVNHPGTRPQPFIRPVFKQKFIQIVAQNAERHLSGDAEIDIEV